VSRLTLRGPPRRPDCAAVVVVGAPERRAECATGSLPAPKTATGLWFRRVGHGLACGRYVTSRQTRHDRSRTAASRRCPQTAVTANQSHFWPGGGDTSKHGSRSDPDGGAVGSAEGVGLGAGACPVHMKSRSTPKTDQSQSAGTGKAGRAWACGASAMDPAAPMAITTAPHSEVFMRERLAPGRPAVRPLRLRPARRSRGW
jgi:hypothetical protein